MYCPQCGKEIVPGTNFCGYCGEKIVVPVRKTYEEESQFHTKPKRSKSSFLLPLGIIVLGVLIGLSVFLVRETDYFETGREESIIASRPVSASSEASAVESSTVEKIGSAVKTLFSAFKDEILPSENAGSVSPGHDSFLPQGKTPSSPYGGTIRPLTEEELDPSGMTGDGYIIAPVFGNDSVYRFQILSVSFYDTTENVPQDAWNIASDGTVLAWLTEADPSSITDETLLTALRQDTRTGKVYDLHIASDGIIFAPEDCMDLFAEFQSAKSIRFNGVFNTSNVTSMYDMFYRCRALTQLDLSGFDTSNVMKMTGMFRGCNALTQLDVSSFDTSNVMSMWEMFHSCSSLTQLDVSSFDTSNVTNMGNLFQNCSALTELDLSGFDTSSVTDMHHMFIGCSSLTQLDVSSFDTSNVTNMESMFYGCRALTQLDLSDWDISNVTDMESMFYDCPAETQERWRTLFSGYNEDASDTAAVPQQQERAGAGSVSERSPLSSEDDFKTAKLVDKYFAALKSGDFNTAMECFTPEYRNSFLSELGIPDELVRMNRDVLNAFVGTLLGWSTSLRYRNYRFEVVGTEYPDNRHAIVSFDVYIDDAFSRTARVACKKYNDNEWLLDDSPDESIYGKAASAMEKPMSIPGENETPDGDRRRDKPGQSKNADYLETTFSSGSGNIGNTTVRLKKGFDFVNTGSSQYNSELALTAVTLSAQVYPDAAGDHAETILDKLGYDRTRTVAGGNLFIPQVCFGYKNLGEGKNIFTAVVRGTAADDDTWTDFFSGMGSMFENTGKSIAGEFISFMKEASGKSEEQLKAENNYFFFTGHSLGGAVANYLSINDSVMAYVHQDKEKIYTYTFESPHTCINLLWMDTEGMSNAFNFKVEGDAVTNLPPWPGSTTYGKDIIFKVDDLSDTLFNELFPFSKGKTVNAAVSVDGHGDPWGLHDICLDLLQILDDEAFSYPNVEDTEEDIPSAVISMNPLVFECMHTLYGELKERYPVTEPQFVNNGRYYVQIPDKGLTLWYQNDNWTADPRDYCQAVTGNLSDLTVNMPERITLAEFNAQFEPYSQYENYTRYDNHFEIVDSPNTAYYISRVQFAKVNFCGFWERMSSGGVPESGGSGGLLEIDLDSVENLGGDTKISSTFFGRVSSLAG